MKMLSHLSVVLILLAFLGCRSTQSSDAKSETAAPEPTVETEALVKINTDYGNMTVKLFNQTPLHRDNFLKLVKDGFYDDLLFHRVINGFMIQGGDPVSKNAGTEVLLGQGGPGYTIPAEIVPNLIHKKGTLAAARMGDAVNPQRASSGSQFYLVQGKVYPLEELNRMEQQFGITFTQLQKELYSTVGGTPHLDNQYTVFGEVTEGIEIIDAIAAVKTLPGDRPAINVNMRMEVIRDYTPAK